MNRSRAAVTTLALILPLVLLLFSLQMAGSHTAEAAPVDLAPTQSLSPQAPAIVLDMTVGTEPGRLRTTNQLSSSLGWR